MVSFNGRPEDLLREVGMSLNSLIRRLVGDNGTKPMRSTFLRPENAQADWIRQHVVLQVAIALQMRPEEKRNVNLLMQLVKDRYKIEIDQWIEDNRDRLAELGFVFDEEDGQIRFDRFGRRTSR